MDSRLSWIGEVLISYPGSRPWSTAATSQSEKEGEAKTGSYHMKLPWNRLQTSLISWSSSCGRKSSTWPIMNPALIHRRAGLIQRVAKSCGDALIQYIPTEEERIICKSVAYPFQSEGNLNLRVQPPPEAFPKAPLIFSIPLVTPHRQKSPTSLLCIPWIGIVRSLCPSLQGSSHEGHSGWIHGRWESIGLTLKNKIRISSPMIR